MTPMALLRDAYRELDETGSLSLTTLRNLDTAGIDTRVLTAISTADLED
jgi:hypothetical protein